MYGKIMSRLITVFWILQVTAVIALGAASLVAIDGKRDRLFPASVTDVANSSNAVHLRKYSDVQSDICASFCVFVLGARNRF